MAAEGRRWGRGIGGGYGSRERPPEADDGGAGAALDQVGQAAGQVPLHLGPVAVAQQLPPLEPPGEL